MSTYNVRAHNLKLIPSCLLKSMSLWLLVEGATHNIVHSLAVLGAGVLLVVMEFSPYLGDGWSLHKFQGIPFFSKSPSLPPSLLPSLSHLHLVSNPCRFCQNMAGDCKPLVVAW